MKKSLFIVLFLSSPMLLAQHQWEFGIDLKGAFPRGEFEEFTDDGAGVGLRLGYAPRAGAWSVGLDVAVVEFDDITYDDPFGDCCLGLIDEIEIANQAVMGHVFLKWEDRDGFFRPYVEGLAGLKHLENKTRFLVDGDEEIDTDTNFDDTAFSWGAGLGMSFRLMDQGPSGNVLLLKAGCRWLHGGEAEYVPEGGAFLDGDVLVTEIVRSETDLFTADIGLSFKF